MPDSIRKRFCYGQLWPLRPACSQNQAGSYMPDPTSCIRFSSVFFFQRRHGSYCAKPTWIRSGWPGQGLAKRIWSGSKLMCRDPLSRHFPCCKTWRIKNLNLNLNHISRPGFCQNATDPLSISHFRTRFCSATDVPDNTVYNQPGSDLVLADGDRCWPNRSGPEAAGVQESSGPLVANASQPIRIGSGMFTGLSQAKTTERVVANSVLKMAEHHI